MKPVNSKKTECHSIKLIGCQAQYLMKCNCMQSVNQKNLQSVKMYQHFPVFLSIFLLDLSSSSIKKFKDTCMLHSTFTKRKIFD